jgi:DNA-binding CsgD family transcriptional regulator/tetratricopeptide (TPR) repeat protein
MASAGPRRQAARRQLERERESIEAVLAWLTNRSLDDAVTLASLVWPIWDGGDVLAEGYSALERLLQRVPAQARDHRAAKARAIAGYLAIRGGDYRRAQALLEAARSDWDAGDNSLERREFEVALASVYLNRGALADAEGALARSLAIAPGEAGDWLATHARALTARLAAERGDLDGAERLLVESGLGHRELSDDVGLSLVTTWLAEIALAADARTRARERLDLAMDLAQAAGEPRTMVQVLLARGDLALVDGEYSDAASTYRQALTIGQQLGDLAALAALIEGIVALEMRCASPDEERRATARVAAALRHQTGTVRPTLRDRWLGRDSGPTDELPWQAPVSIDAVVQHAQHSLSHLPSSGRATKREQANSAPRMILSPRERDVVRLISRGLTNRQIALALGIAERTVDSHVGNVLRKLELTSRAQIAAWTVRRELVSQQ